jgi:hypothetical protein
MLGGIDLGDYVGFVPGVAVSFLVSLALANHAGRVLGIPRTHSWAILIAVGIILSATLTPSRDALEYGTTGHAMTCDLTRIGPASLAELLANNDASLNVLLFGPLGIAIGLLPRSRRKAAMISGATALPFIIESTQLLVPLLGRACQSSDVADNLTGLVLGLAVGTAAGRVAAALQRADGRK